MGTKWLTGSRRPGCPYAELEGENWKSYLTPESLPGSFASFREPSRMNLSDYNMILAFWRAKPYTGKNPVEFTGLPPKVAKGRKPKDKHDRTAKQSGTKGKGKKKDSIFRRMGPQKGHDEQASASSSGKASSGGSSSNSMFGRLGSQEGSGERASGSSSAMASSSSSQSSTPSSSQPEVAPERRLSSSAGSGNKENSRSIGDNSQGSAGTHSDSFRHFLQGVGGKAASTGFRGGCTHTIFYVLY